MTIEELLELPANDIAKLTDAQLELHLRKYFPATRPAGVLENALAVALNKREAKSPELSEYEKRLEAEYAARCAAKPTGIPVKQAPAAIRIKK